MKIINCSIPSTVVAVDNMDGVFVVVEKADSVDERVFLNIEGSLVVVGDVAEDEKVTFVEVDLSIMVSNRKINITECS